MALWATTDAQCGESLLNENMNKWHWKMFRNTDLSIIF